MFHANSLLGFFFGPEDGGDMLSENSVDIQQTLLRYIPEDRTLHNHRCDNLKSYISTLGGISFLLSIVKPLNSSIVRSLAVADGSAFTAAFL
jgi:hypothetical protein